MKPCRLSLRSISLGTLVLGPEHGYGWAIWLHENGIHRWWAGLVTRQLDPNGQFLDAGVLDPQSMPVVQQYNQRVDVGIPGTRFSIDVNLLCRPFNRPVGPATLFVDLEEIRQVILEALM